MANSGRKPNHDKSSCMQLEREIRMEVWSVVSGGVALYSLILYTIFTGDLHLDDDDDATAAIVFIVSMWSQINK